tara:strand:- start:736 stop:2172 length:1437 start_codon:yes stop_codon:yes gene_type:complete
MAGSKPSIQSGYDKIESLLELYPLDVRGNKTKIAAALTLVHPERNHKGWEALVFRYIKAQKETSNTIQYDKSPYYYNEEADTYITFIRAAGENMVINGDMHRAMKSAYSNMASKGATINEIAREFNFPRAYFDEYRRVHCWTHDMLPYTDEEVMGENNDELVADLILRNRREIHKQYEKKKWKEIEQAAEKWFNFEDTYKGMIGDLQKAPKKVPKAKLADAKEPFCVVMSPTDFHWGKHGWVDEVGETYNFEEARSRLLERTNEIISWLPARPDKIILATGSDWFHVDNDLGMTTRGTPQDMCGSPAQILITGCQLAREHIDILRQVAPVEVAFMAGNHDRHSAIALMLYLSAAYEDVDDVEVQLNPKTRHYTQYGATLIGFNHGDSVKKEKLPTLMSKEQRVLWGKTESHIWFTGHLHHQVLYEMDGGLVIQLPSLAGHDRYHYRAGYTTAKAGLAAHIIDKELGLIGSIFSPVRHT